MQTSSIIPATSTPVVISPTPTPLADEPIFYTVKLGDTLEAIAAQFNIDMYGLARANNLTDVNFITVGQKLLIATAPITAPASTISEGKQIVVVLSTQRTYAYEDGILLKEFIVSTGVADFPTVTGLYSIQTKLESTQMTDGVTYDLPNVLWTMYFFRGYGFHGTYWHNNFGVPMSHGCVNMNTDDAKWLFDWAPVGTPVLVLP
ncbi:MAG: hypothetical protein UW80_C0039G0003 [Microgenomates group bacterium GW2011_GWC1_44_9]|nr:MAG: hypothetical protein UW80_C0039G0003 [Microgenomates group bacterium GW2011_GWC1_44_9]